VSVKNDDNINPAIQARLDELQATLDRQQAEIATAREEREQRQQAVKSNASGPSKAKRSLTRAAPQVHPDDVYDDLHPDDAWAVRWKDSHVPREHAEQLALGDLEAVARRLDVEPEYVPAVVVATMHKVRLDPGGWRTGPQADYLDVPGLERIMRKAIKELSERDEDVPKASIGVLSGAPDYSQVLPRRRSASTPLVQALFSDPEKDRNRRHAKQLADGLKADQEASEKAKRTRDEEEATSGTVLPMNHILGAR